MIPIPKPIATIFFGLAVIAVGFLGFINADESGARSGLPAPLLGAFAWAIGIYFIVGSIRELQRRKRAK
jgi:hypothetical protein